jgi:dienelactone hydrolase
MRPGSFTLLTQRAASASKGTFMQLKSTAFACCLLAACTPQPVQTGTAVKPGTGTTSPAPAGGLASAGSSAAPSGAAGTGLAGPVAGSSVGSTAGSAAIAAGSGASPTAGTAAVGGSAGTSGAVAGSGSIAGAGAAAGSGAVAGAGGSAAPMASGCPGSTMLAVPSDTNARGPWPVGEKTVKFGRFTAVEIMYPATPGSEQGKDTIKYDLRSFLPTKEQAKIPDAQATFADQHTFRDLPLDTDHGPYPVVIFVHGTSSYRVGSFSTEALWASRGFVVVAADHPNLYLADYFGANGCGLTVPKLDLSGDVDSEIDALTSPTGDLAFLAGHVDTKRLGLSGHSAGAYNVAQFSTKPGVQIVIPLAGTHAVTPSSTLKSVLFVSGIADKVLAYMQPQAGVGESLYPGTGTDAYTASPGSPVKKRLVGITNGGHLNVTDLCEPNPQGKSAIDCSTANGVCGASTVQILGLADCGSVDRKAAIDAVNDVTTAALEETLQCADRSATISALKTRRPVIGDFHEAVQ